MSSDNVVTLPGHDRMTAFQALDLARTAAMAGEIKDVVIIMDVDGDRFRINSSDMCQGEVMMLLEQAKLVLLGALPEEPESADHDRSG